MHVRLSSNGPSGVVERVHAVAQQRLVRVHAGAIDAEDRLGHERRVHAVAPCDVLDDEPEGADVVGRGQHVVVPEVDLVLAPGRLVMRGLDLEPHLLEHQHDLATDVLALIHRREVEVARRVVRLGRRLVVSRLEQEELGLGPGTHGEAARPGLLDRTLERLPRAPGERGAVRVGDVADEAGHLLARRIGPREDPERREIGREEHVRFLDAHESFDRGAVEHHLPVEGGGELPVGHLDVLDHPEDVGELQPQELHTGSPRPRRGSPVSGSPGPGPALVDSK